MTKTLKQIIDENIEIIENYKQIEGKSWNAEGTVIELMKQVGELCKMIMVKENYYFPNRSLMHEGYEVSDEEIADELADILRAVIRLAHYYNLDIEKANNKAIEMDKKVIADVIKK